MSSNRVKDGKVKWRVVFPMYHGRRIAECVIACLLLLVVVPVWGQEMKTRRSRHSLRRAHASALQAQARASNAVLAQGATPAFDPPEQTIGERLFLETRFAQFFAANYEGNVNQPLTQGDPTVTYVATTDLTDRILGPFAGTSMNCRSCHFVDDVSEGGNRTYADFAQHSPIPDRGDHHTVAPRNALNMVDSNIPRGVGLLLHGDGEFARLEELVDSTMTGRNFGWLPNEYLQAKAHIAKIIREDDGRGILAKDYGSLSYAKLLLGTSTDIPPDLLLPPEYRINVGMRTDDEVVDAVSNLVSAYVFSLTFSRNLDGVHDGSPYDRFLAKNSLPAAPANGESEDAYSQRLSQAVNQLQSPVFVDPGDGAFETHDQRFAFGPTELQGLKLFLRQTPDLAAARSQPNFRLLAVASLPALGFVYLGWIGIRQQKCGLPIVAVAGFLCCCVVACGGSGNVDTSTPIAEARHVGNCIACHVAPNFTDFSMRNTGASQEEYDSIHGDGSFSQLAIPGYAEREANRDQYLPPTPLHPNSSGRFRASAARSDSSLADLGMWNVYANTDFPEPQPRLQSLMCAPASVCDPNRVLPLTIGRFKTPTLRDLGHSQPYFHTGRMSTIEKVLDFYRHTSLLAQSGKLRNPDPAIGAISIDSQDERALAAFLRALNEDYN